MDIWSLLRYFECRMTPEEEAQVHSWLLDDTDGSHAKMYKDAHLIYEGMTLWNEGNEVATKAPAVKPLWKRSLLWIAQVAAVVAAVICTGLWTKDRLVDSLSSEYEIVSVPSGERMEMTLADGTHMWLNSCTEVEVPVVFSRKSRNLKVNKGEVLLEVSKDEDRPFIVDTWAGKVKVRGTKFDVIADETDNIFSVALINGSVEVASKLKAEKYILKPNDIVKMLDGNLCLERIGDASLIDSWSRGLFDVTSMPFDELMRRFEKAYDVDIVIEREELPVVTYSRGKIRISDGVSHAMTMLQMASDFTWSFDREANVIVIR